MQVNDFGQELLGSFSTLVNKQTESLLPNLVFSQEQVVQIIARGASLWALHYPEATLPGTLRMICVVENSEVLSLLADQ